MYFDGHYCNKLISVLTETIIEPNYDKCNQYKGILVLHRAFYNVLCDYKHL